MVPSFKCLAFDYQTISQNIRFGSIFNKMHGGEHVVTTKSSDFQRESACPKPQFLGFSRKCPILTRF